MSGHIEAILKLLASAGYKPATESEIRRKLGIRKHQKKSFYKDLKKLRRQGRIKKTKGGRYILVPDQRQEQVFLGVLVRKNGTYMLSTSDGELRLPSLINPLHAIVGDTVLVRIERTRRGYIARIIKVVSRKYSRIIGYVERIANRWILAPFDRDIDFTVRLEETAGADSGDVVLCQITAFPEGGKKATGRVVKVYGNQYDDTIDEAVVIDKYNLPHLFSSEALAQANRLDEPSTEEFVDREDFRDMPVITIDGEDAKDFDDAVDVEKRKNGYRLYVHIADVSHYVSTDSPIDREAIRRCFSVYFPGSVIPMLPKRLSDNICSLVPYKDRLTLSVIIDFDQHGNVQAYRFTKGVINNKRRMTYRQVQAILDGELEDEKWLMKKLELMGCLARILRKKRFREGSIDLDIPEPQFKLEGNRVVDIQKRPRLFSHFIIEEFMLAANLCAADFLDRHYDSYIRRVHDEPDRKKIASLIAFLKRYGIHFEFSLKKITSKALQKLLESVKDANRKSIISYLMLRSLKRAEYSTRRMGHFALGFDNYTHFTSPIRRYPDLVVHRMVKALLEGRRFDTSSLEYVASVVRERELVTEEAMFYMNDVKSASFMRNHIGEAFKGVIVNIIPAGIFVRLDRYFVEGFISVDRMRDDYYEFYEELFAMIGRRRHKVYRLGDRVRVAVVSINKFAGEIDLIFA